MKALISLDYLPILKYELIFLEFFESVLFTENFKTVNFDLYGLVSRSVPPVPVINGESEPLLSRL